MKFLNKSKISPLHLKKIELINEPLNKNIVMDFNQMLD